MRSLALLCLLAFTPAHAATSEEDQAMEAYTKCFAKKAPSQSWFAAAIKKAQSQLELLPLR